VTTFTNALVHSLTLARSEAIKSVKDVTVASEGGVWSDGWTVTRDDGTVVRTFNDPPKTGAIAGTNGVDPMTFQPMGNVAAGECFDITVTGATRVRSVLVPPSGRVTTCETDCATVLGDFTTCR
jgi:Tfp pilus assembly protein FimT